MDIPKTPLQQPGLAPTALLLDALMRGEGWRFEPKWDSFRCLVFRSGQAVVLQLRQESRPGALAVLLKGLQ